MVIIITSIIVNFFMHIVIIMQYSYGIPGTAIWATHLLIGLFLLYVGHATLNHQPIYQTVSVILMILGSIVILYHGHLMYLNLKA